VVDAPIAELARLKLAALDEAFELTDDHRRFGPTIVRRVAAAWSAAASEA
jgi:hypothetical protein